MKYPYTINVQGLANKISESEKSLFQSRISIALNQLIEKEGIDDINITIYISSKFKDTQEQNRFINGNSLSKSSNNDNDLSVEERARRYKAVKPLFDFEQLIVPEQVKEDLFLAVDLVELETQVFDTWGLREIEPFPRTALNFYGKPGTGKTLAAHAIASKINRPILVASYAQIESMYSGEGPKNVEAIFFAAERDNALLFVDEADSLLSKRLTNVTQGSEQAINSMRSQLLICLERFRGVVIFSTNLVENYDKAFETRVRNIKFPLPDKASRQEIWKRHLPTKLPLATNVSCEKLAEVEDVCGRDIKNAVIDAAMRVARKGKNIVELSNLLDSIERIKTARIKDEPDSEKLSPEEEAKITEKVKAALDNQEQETKASDNLNDSSLTTQLC